MDSVKRVRGGEHQRDRCGMKLGVLMKSARKYALDYDVVSCRLTFLGAVASMRQSVQITHWYSFEAKLYLWRVS